VRSVELLLPGANAVAPRVRGNAADLRLSGRNLTWMAPSGERARLELVSADGRRTALPTGSGSSGTVHLPATAGLCWAVLRTGGGATRVAVPPGR